MPDFFERLIEEIVSSSNAPEGAAVVRRSPAVRRPRQVRPGRRLLVALAVLCVPGTLGGLALAGTFEERRISPQQWVEGRRVAPAVAVAPAQAADLGILRRARVDSDALPPSSAYDTPIPPRPPTGRTPHCPGGPRASPAAGPG